MHEASWRSCGRATGVQVVIIAVIVIIIVKASKIGAAIVIIPQDVFEVGSVWNLHDRQQDSGVHLQRSQARVRTRIRYMQPFHDMLGGVVALLVVVLPTIVGASVYAQDMICVLLACACQERTGLTKPKLPANVDA